jgi:hypothetical protein
MFLSFKKYSSHAGKKIGKYQYAVKCGIIIFSHLPLFLHLFPFKIRSAKADKCLLACGELDVRPARNALIAM